MTYFNTARPHQALQQLIPDPPTEHGPGMGSVRSTPILNGLHHTYGRPA